MFLFLCKAGTKSHAYHVIDSYDVRERGRRLKGKLGGTRRLRGSSLTQCHPHHHIVTIASHAPHTPALLFTLSFLFRLFFSLCRHLHNNQVSKPLTSISASKSGARYCSQ